MKFLTLEDFKTVCDDNTLSVINQTDSANMDRAENYAIEEISSYLRSKYDVSSAFSASGDARSSWLVMLCCDVCLYHLIAWLPKRIGFEIRELRYNRAISFLKDVQNSKASPDLPPLQTDTGSPVSGFRFGSWRQNDFQY